MPAAKPSPAEMAKTLGSFVLLEESPSLVTLDRSTLENAAACPFMACAIQEGKVNFPAVLHTGNEIHDALSRATLCWVESDGAHYPSALKEELITELRSARPDLQPDALAGCAAAAWTWAQHLAEHCHPGNILAFDGGEAVGKSGQLAVDFEDLGVRVTSEIDLLYSGPSDELLHETDYKTGHKQHTAADVAHSFQFQLHAVLVFATWPTVRGLEVTVWNTRTNQRSYRVTFDRKRLPDYTSRVRLGVQAYMTEVLGKSLDDPESLPVTWPTHEKCSQCSAASLCPAAGQEIGDVARDPKAALRQLVALDAKRKALTKALAAHVDKTKQDVVADGVAFGRDKPKSTRKATAAIYKAGGEESEEEASE